ncbi:ChbG/HpnK family deacetylase [Alloacidobacterium dinghuense]|uniref:ChbG/HpnK family deacetylase n=1 Tax=Alloacidobacterium dinghuense TaxID=2763107 RepID=A0A7G8BLR6_9BACT|nr:ChbG/HpnK family deacetylase [Alloacidobacterium dinghuense]QNI33486.1 ChbG/HpnK family deacetylase [Alloacidobacterium dinghuense]
MKPTTFTSNINETGVEAQPVGPKGKSLRTGRLIINADDWGRDRETTDRTLDCVRRGTVSSVSAMVFMEDSERAAGIARDHGIDTGLHLNFTSAFSALGLPSQLVEHQKCVSQYLLRHRLSQVVFHPGLIRSFEYVLTAQRDEFIRLYGQEPRRLDGHHHMHLCANVLFGGLLPPGTTVRRNFSFEPGEKSSGNRCYRRVTDWALDRHHRLTNFFFSIQPLAPLDRLQRIVNLSRQFIVEVETHPQDPAEYAFLTGDGIDNLVGTCVIASRYDVGPSETGR